MEPATPSAPHYLNVNYGIRSWLFTVDHKRIALLYLISITAMFLIGGIFAGLIRLELLTPAGDIVESDTYNKLFTSLACVTCHTGEAGSRGPGLGGVFGHEVELQGGGKIVADEAYLRESIVNPQAKVVAGFPPIMPPFQGMVSEEQLLQLIAYLKSLKGPAAQPAAPAQQK